MKFNDIKNRAVKIYESKQLFRAHLEGQDLFPLVLPLPKVRSADLSKNFAVCREQYEIFAADCFKCGVEIKLKKINHRMLGEQILPCEVVIPSKDIFLGLISKKSEFEDFEKSVAVIMTEYPQLKDYLLKYPEKAIEYGNSWDRLLRVCRFLVENGALNLYIRQLEIPEVDTKFIENHKRILSELLNILLPKEVQKSHLPERDIHFFEERYGFKKEPPRLRFRVLDPSLRKIFFGFEDIETSVSDLARTEIPCETVFVVENKITGLCLPDREKAIVFFELGYKAGILKELTWLKNKRIIYWGDIDTHGFSILSQVRSVFPHVESRLMCPEILEKYNHLWTIEDARYSGECPNLTEQEQALFQDLKLNRYGYNIRLEQERIALTEFKV